ncbi:hypothetical protein CVT24_011881 [Panaeolus cyanescens]|uniref:Kinetochore protein SPC25 n=1 Tax=Panaeolus cyanescens TaxID=181874 RepID=A0A409YNK5_9AGAR|nr:hypothetical protein CVT24_011881 [Panaeolus cyanescens]
MAHQPKHVSRINLKKLLDQEKPRIDLQIPTYEASTLSFLSALNTHKQRVIAQCSERAEEAKADLRRATKLIQNADSDIKRFKIQEGELKKQIQREAQERQDAEVVVLTLQRQIASVRDSIAAVEAEWEDRKKCIKALTEENSSETVAIDSFQHQNVELTQLLAEQLGCTFHGVANQDQCLLICFKYLDPKKPDSDIQAYFALDSSLVASGGPYRGIIHHIPIFKKGL